MSVIAVTGAYGVVGQAIVPRIEGAHDVVPIDLPDVDILDSAALEKAMRGADTVIHLAGVFDAENWRTKEQDPRNRAMFEAVTRQAVTQGVQQFIHASSIHVENTLGFLESRNPNQQLIALPGDFDTEPSSGYGLTKRFEERSLQTISPMFIRGAVSLRFGGVAGDNQPLQAHDDPAILNQERRVWLEYDDLGTLVNTILEDNDPAMYDVLYAISNNTGRFHGIANRYGWLPLADSANYL